MAEKEGLEEGEEKINALPFNSKKLVFLLHMKWGVVIFPGSNCDHDLIRVLNNTASGDVVELWHKDTDLKGCTHIFLPGGFSYGDYLRSGSIAKLSPIMDSVREHAENGGFVMGICNGFQILCESGLLPGALIHNTNMKFICKNVHLTPVSKKASVSKNVNGVIQIPIAHGEGRFFCNDQELEKIEANDQVLFRYSAENGEVSANTNPNGSLNNIAGVCNDTFNVFGMMPHPERAAEGFLLNQDGMQIIQSIIQESNTVHA